MEELIVGLAGNPNVGKTTVFNQLTGMRQHVGNWPGKTVERAEGSFKHGSYEYDCIKCSLHGRNRIEGFHCR